MDKNNCLCFCTNTKALITEILEYNNQNNIFLLPLKIFYEKLREVANRCSQINDPILNKLMCDLSLYSITDQHDSNYNLEKVKEVEERYCKLMEFNNEQY